MLSIKELSKTYANGVRALRNVSLEIPRGMFGLLGPNGAGKSTLMRTLATLQEPDSGSACLGEIDVLKQKDEVRRRLGYLPQEFGVYPKVSAETMLDHLAVLKGIGEARRRREVVRALLAQTNLYDVRKRKLGTFSGGMKQRFGIAQALLGDPKLIIVDEPTAGLDPAERLRFHNLLAEIGENIVVRGAARFESSNGQALAAYVHPPANKIGVLVKAEGSPDAARRLAMHIAFAAPRYATREEIPEEDVTAEREIYEKLPEVESKPEQARPKIVEGMLGKRFFAENVLAEQPWIHDPKKTVEEALAEEGLKVLEFERYALAE